MMGKPNSGNPKQQMSRLKLILAQINKARQSGSDLLIALDANLDLNDQNFPSSRYDVKDMQELYSNYLISNNLFLHNSKPTFHRKGQRSTLIDHIISNCQEKVNSVEQKRSNVADHDLISVKYHSKELSINPQFRHQRNLKNINRSNMINWLIKNEEKVNNILSLTDTNNITNSIIDLMNMIVEELAPEKIIQIKKDDQPYIDNEIKIISKEANEELTEAINMNDDEKWKKWKMKRNQLSKEIESKKLAHYIKELQHPRKKWKVFNNLTVAGKSTFPRSIINNNETVKSPKKLAELANNFFVDKINIMRSKFTKSKATPIEVLEELVPKIDNNCIIKQITTNECQKIIKDLKPSRTTSFDAVDSMMTKEIPEITAVLLTHMINSSLRQNKFPEILKLSRIIPISKPGKKQDQMSSYRPISCLHTYEKIYKEWLRINMMKHIEENNIILPNHHCGLKYHSTLTAKSLLDYHSQKAWDKDKLNIILSTDLSSAFDTVDHKILIEKLKYYGFRGPTATLLSSYLSNRTQLVKIDTKKSTIITAPPCSVVQGSKLSAILYILYTNKVPKLHNLLTNKVIMKKLINENPINTEGINHEVVNYIDDSNSSITFDDPKQADDYLLKYFKLIESYYNMSKLEINTDKTNFMVICHPNKEVIANQIKLPTSTEVVIQKPQFKVLGWITNNEMSMEPNINRISGILAGRINAFNQITKYSDEKTRLQNAHVHLLSILSYGMPLYSGETQFIKKRSTNPS